MRLRSRDLFATVHTEGGLLPADLLQRIADGDRTLDGLTPGDYHLDPGERLNERITRAWTRLSAAWRNFDQARQQLPAGDPASTLTRERWLQILFDELGYGRLVQQPAIEIEGKPYPIFTQWLNTPIHLVGAGITLDHRTAGVRGAAAQSPHSLLQELLNRSPERLWGIVANGLILRLLRDNISLTRQAYVQFDLEAMFTGEVYSDFALLWLVCHQSRVEAATPEACWLERWSRTAADTGTRSLRSTITARCCGSSTGCCSCSSPRTATRCLTLTQAGSPRTATPRTTRPRTCASSPASAAAAATTTATSSSSSSWEPCTSTASPRSRCPRSAATCGTPPRSARLPTRSSQTRTCSPPSARSRPSSTSTSVAPWTFATSGPRNSAPSTNHCSSCTHRSTATPASSRSPPSPARSARPPAATTRPPR